MGHFINSTLLSNLNLFSIAIFSKTTTLKSVQKMLYVTSKTGSYFLQLRLSNINDLCFSSSPVKVAYGLSLGDLCALALLNKSDYTIFFFVEQVVFGMQPF